jgi:HEAT repeat protein
MIRHAGIAGWLLTGVLLCYGQQTQAPDYAKKPLAQWIDGFHVRNEVAVRDEARSALGPRGPYAKVAVPALLDALPRQQLVTSDVAATLADYGPAVVPVLMRALKRPEAPVRATAAEALGLVRPRPVDSVSALVASMKDPAPEVRCAAAGSLATIGRPLEQTIPALVVGLGDEKNHVRQVTAAALFEMGRKSRSALPALMKALKDKDERVRELAAQTLGKIGPEAKPAVPALIAALQNKQGGSDRSTVAQALGDIGPEAKEAVPTLIEALQTDDEMLQRWASVALGEIGPAAKGAVPALIAAAKKPGNPAGDSAIAALGQIGPEARAAVPFLMDALSKRGRHRYFPYTVAQALGGIGPPARDAVPLLAAIAQEPLDGNTSAYEPTRKAAAQAVMKIDPDYGTKHHIAFAYLNVRLGPIPPIKLGPRPPQTEATKKRIKRLIAGLAEVADPDFGLSATLTGFAFAPVPDLEHFAMGVVTDHRLKSSGTFRSLVEIGPDALDALLDALDDKTPTKLKVEGIGMVFFGAELDGNPLNAAERGVLAQQLTGKEDDESDGDEKATGQVLTVGDVCFVAIGQIVGRHYSAVRYQPTAMIIINSPVRSKELRDRVRGIWSSKNPAQKLLDSLLIDYATLGKFNGKSLDGWSEGSRRQIEAAVRLLYYFPKESAPLIAERLKRLDVARPKEERKGWMLREVANGARTTELLKALTWCKEPAIRQALLDLFLRSDDARVTLAVLPAVKETRADLIIPRLRSLLHNLPKSEGSPRGDGYDLLLALGQHAGNGAKADFESYLREGSLQRRWTVCWVLEEVHREWAVEFLTPMLTDKRTGYARSTLRLCDAAAWVLSKIHPELQFDAQGTPEELDRRIDRLRKQLAQQRTR